MRPVDADYILRLIPPEEVCSRYIVSNAPTKDAINRNKLVETIKHCMQYPDGLNRLLAIYEGERNEQNS